MAMFGRSPVSITTDHDTVIGSAMTQVFPETRRHFCEWHIFEKCQEKLFLQHPTFETDFHKCVNLTDSTVEFESCWLTLADKYDLRDHEWLKTIYAACRHWVPVYRRDAFLADVNNRM